MSKRFHPPTSVVAFLADLHRSLWALRLRSPHRCIHPVARLHPVYCVSDTLQFRAGDRLLSSERITYHVQYSEREQGGPPSQRTGFRIGEAEGTE
jgi:hypothetical protein